MNENIFLKYNNDKIKKIAYGNLRIFIKIIFLSINIIEYIEQARVYMKYTKKKGWVTKKNLPAQPSQQKMSQNIGNTSNKSEF